MLQRFGEEDPTLQDHELLEVLLFGAIPRKNTNGIAHDLLSAFGSLYGVLHATLSQLCTVSGIGKSAASYLRSVGMIYDRIEKARDTFPDKFNLGAFSSYLTEHYKGLGEESLEVFCLDANERVRMNKRFTSRKPDDGGVQRVSGVEPLSRDRRRAQSSGWFMSPFAGGRTVYRADLDALFHAQYPFLRSSDRRERRGIQLFQCGQNGRDPFEL